MTNVVHKTLNRFGKAALGVNSKINYGTRSKQCINAEFLEALKTRTSINLNQSFNNTVNTNKIRFSSSDTGTEQTDKNKVKDEKRSSSDHQNYHRKKYERNRSYQRQNFDANKSASHNVLNDPDLQMNHYQRLNIETDADAKAIKSAYYNLSKIYHPDIVGPEDRVAAENFRLITESYDILCDPKQREMYDTELNQSKRSYSTSTMDWTRPAHPNQDFKIVFRSKDADSMFRFKQDSAFELDKFKNPNKYRSGNFQAPNSDDDHDHYRDYDERLERITRRLSEFNVVNDVKQGNFYRIHLYDTLMRKQRDMVADRNAFSSRAKSEETSALISISIALMIIGGFTIAILNAFIKIDFAGYLDARLQQRFKGAQKKEDPSKT